MFDTLFTLQGLSLDRLRSFLAFADAQSIVRAAEGDAVRQSLISRQIRELEQFFGVELVRRQGRGLVLTDAGRRLATLAREQFGALSEFAREARAMPSTLDMIAPNSIAAWLLMPRLTAIRRRMPNHQLLIQHEQTAAIIRGVLEGSHDIGFVREPNLPRTLGRRSLGGSGFALFVPKSLVGQLRSHEGGAWLRLPLALPIGGALRESVARYATKIGLTLAPVLACDSYLQAAAAVESGAVASILPEIAAPSFAGRNVQMIPVPELSARHLKTWMIWSKRAAATRSSVQLAVDTLPDLLAID